MKVVFFGTPEYVLPILKALAKRYEIAGVVTQSPKPTGRKQFLTYSPVDTWAHKRKIPVYYQLEDLLKENSKFDLGVIADYGKIISQKVIDLFVHGIINIHFSLLPQYRGASPVQSAILSGDKEIGVTIFRIDEKLDHGPIINQFKEPIEDNDTWGNLKIRLFERTEDILMELLPVYLKGKIKLKTQDESQATYTKILKKEDGYLDLKKAKPEEAERLIRAMNPWPGAWSHIKILGEKDTKILRIKLLKAHLEDKKLILDEVQLEGKTAVSWKQFNEAYPTARFSSTA